MGVRLMQACGARESNECDFEGALNSAVLLRRCSLSPGEFPRYCHEGRPCVIHVHASIAIEGPSTSTR